MEIFKKNDASTSALVVTLVAGAAALIARLLIWTNSFHSGLLYIAWPVGLSLALYYLTPHTDGDNWRRRFWNNFRLSTIALLAASLLLMEGYVCVVMAMPLFFLGFLIAFGIEYIMHRSDKGSKKVYVLPAIVLLLSLEGVSVTTTVPRRNVIIYTGVVLADVALIKQRLSNPALPQGRRHWILSLFPMPKSIGSVGLKEGDVRIYEFVYHRWFATNTHSGTLRVKFVDVSEDRIVTMIEDESYIAGYLKLLGSELNLEPTDGGATKVTLKVVFDRVLDPSWYFGPLERFAARKAMAYFVNEILGPTLRPSQLGDQRR